jgi:NAD(P)-dependent dehydrogenase (short-subunit alcohol dehydrogenase family)
MPMGGAYSASKAAQIMLTRLAAVEAGSSGIGVNATCPGPTDTPMFQRLASERPEIAEGAARCTPLGRTAQPSEIAAAAAFLASDDASYITGAILPVDGRGAA